jgi:hypothetical protein
LYGFCSQLAIHLQITLLLPFPDRLSVLGTVYQVKRNQLGNIWRLLPRWFRLLVVSSAGFSLLLLGLILLVLPGPGIPVLLTAFLVLGLEFAWAERFLLRMRKRAESVRNFPNRVYTQTESSELSSPNSDTLRVQPNSRFGWFKMARVRTRPHPVPNEHDSITRTIISRKHLLILITVFVSVLFLSMVTWERIL